MSEQTKMSFLDKLSFLMSREGITTAELADGAGIPRDTIYSWYRRKENNPKREHLVLIAKFFNVSLHYLCVDECVSTMPSKDDNPFVKVLRAGETLAFHFDGEITVSDMTDDEIDEIIGFIHYIHAKKDKRLKEEESNNEKQ